VVQPASRFENPGVFCVVGLVGSFSNDPTHEMRFTSDCVTTVAC
jgi:hypothetical protein